MKQILTGSQILLESLIAEGVETVFGYPGGQIMPVYDALYDYQDRLRHILVRHEQGAVHAAQGYAREKGVPGVCMVTSGPGATNVVTGIVDAMMDSTPLVVIAGQVGNAMLGTDAFQEADFLGITLPVTKWSCQCKSAEEVSKTIARAFFIANTGRPGPVVVVLTRDAQVGKAEYSHEKIEEISTYNPVPVASDEEIAEAAKMIDEAKYPFVVYGHGILISHAEQELQEFLAKTNIPAGATMLGLSALPSDCPNYVGMLGMHGNIAPNALTQKCDLLISVGMRFDDRVTGKVSEYASQAKKIHIDIDPAEINKIINVDLGIVSDAKAALSKLIPLVNRKADNGWEADVKNCFDVESEKVIKPETEPGEGTLNMGEVVAKVAEVSGGRAVVVTDVGQNQMISARYSRFVESNSFVSSGGLGTMGFGIPAAIGAKVAVPERPVVLFLGDGGMQMTIEEFGVIMQERLGVKVVLLNNNWLGNVRQWQQLFWNERYSCTRMLNPDFNAIADAYGIRNAVVETREELDAAVRKMLADDEAWILNVHVTEMGMVYPMIPPGKSVDEIMLNNDEWFGNGK
ncbi:MAG: biosynthetic-type acetolactate synthase large subunit [Bacteroidales bacterium]|nr:biosynthetic-type acetolactate synthase large subunit [Bacteroidales bacterium]